MAKTRKKTGRAKHNQRVRATRKKMAAEAPRRMCSMCETSYPTTLMVDDRCVTCFEK